MKDTNIREAYGNLVFLCNGQFPPNPAAVERVFAHVKGPEDMETANKAINVAQEKGILLTPRTTSFWLAACLRAGAHERCLEVLRDHKRTRVFPTPSTIAALIEQAGKEGKGEVAKGAHTLAWYHGLQGRMSVAACQSAIRGLTLVGDLPAATRYIDALINAAEGKQGMPTIRDATPAGETKKEGAATPASTATAPAGDAAAASSQSHANPRAFLRALFGLVKAAENAKSKAEGAGAGDDKGAGKDATRDAIAVVKDKVGAVLAGKRGLLPKIDALPERVKPAFAAQLSYIEATVPKL